MGPDKIPAVILKTLSDVVALPLTIIYNKSLAEGVVPSDWKTAEVTSIFKKGSKSDPGNYRPVSLTSIAGKVLESFVRDQLVDYMETYQLFSKCQHGFRHHKSCVTQLLEVMNDFTNFIENHENIDCIYLDFRKAFDTVPHLRLMNKLKAYGINDNTSKWIYDFLSGRRQRVRVNDSYSEYANVNSGIPQGSILGPVLLIIFINDLPDVVKSLCEIFADDTKIYESNKMHQTLQEDLHKLLEWSDRWQLFFNSSKCSCLHYGSTNKNHTYYIDKNHTTELKTTTSEKDVGVTFSPDLKFDLHISNIVKKANKMTGLIKRSFTYLDKSTFLKLYKTMIRPSLEYANTIWSPQFKRQSVEIEKVQRRATKILKNLKNLTYSERLDKLKLPSLKFRRIRGDLIQAFKIINNIDNVDKDLFFTFRSDDRTRNSENKLYKKFTKSRIRSSFFSERVVNYCNSLSSAARSAKDLLTFKRQIDIELADIAYEYDN